MDEQQKNKLVKDATNEIDKICRFYDKPLFDLPENTKSILIAVFLKGAEITILALKEIQDESMEATIDEAVERQHHIVNGKHT